MKNDNIDDLLVNLDENPEGLPVSKSSSKSADKPAIPPKTSKPSELSFLDDIDSKTSSDEYNEYKDKLAKELSEAIQEVSDEDKEKETEESYNKKPAATAEKDKKILDKTEFIVRGTRTWNTREPYILTVIPEKLNIDYADMLKTFYFVKEEDKSSAVQGEVKRSMFKFIRDPEKNVIKDYTDFINSRLFSLTAEVGNNYGFQKEKLHLFMYHLGVSTLHKILIASLQTLKSGYCFKLLTGNNVVRYIPIEYIKLIIFQWHNNNIKDDNLPYDGIIEYNEMKRIVSRKYTSEYEKYNSKLEDLLAKSNINANKAEREYIFKGKWDEWFGKTNILIYNRFLERTIFKIN